MEHLTKQQIVLLTLLVSFVTSIATGIVSVSLMNQAPVGVTQTINRIVERTIQTVSPTPDTANTASTANTPLTFEDQTATAVDKVSKSFVRIKATNGDSSAIIGFGFVISNDGVIITDKAVTLGVGTLSAIFSDGQEFPIQVIQSQINGDIVFVLPLIPGNKRSGVDIVPVSFAQSIKLGQTVFSLAGKETNTLGEGVISKVMGTTGTTTSVSSISTTIPPANVLVGSPLFSITGDVIGLLTTSLNNADTTVFYPLSLIRSSIPIITR